MTGWVRQHGLGLTLAGVFVIFTVMTLGLGWVEYSSQQADHGRPVELGAFGKWWLYEYSMSLVADVFGAILLVMLTKRLREAGSAESK